MGAALHEYTNGVAPLAVDPDPNTTPPVPGRVFVVPNGKPPPDSPSADVEVMIDGLWMAAVNGPCTVDIWMLQPISNEPAPGVWFKAPGGPFTVNAGNELNIAFPAPVCNVPVFVQIVANVSTTALAVGQVMH